MTSRTYINANGLSVLDGVIRGGQLQFTDTGSDTCFLFRTPDQKLVQCARTTYIKDPHGAPETHPAILAAELLVNEQFSENTWDAPYNLRYNGIIGTEDLVNMSVKKAREKRERLNDVRSLLAALMCENTGDYNIKHVAALLAQTFMLESSYENAFFWLKIAHAGPYRSTQFMLDKAMGQVAESRALGQAPPLKKVGNGYRYRPLEAHEKKERLQKRKRNATEEKKHN